MKKTLILISVLLIAVFCVCLTACGKEEVPDNATFTISFDTQGGSTVAPITIGDGSTVTLPNDPIKEGYKFDGWYLDSSCVTVFDNKVSISKDITLYAKWVEDIVEVVPEGMRFSYDDATDSYTVSDYTGYATEVKIPASYNDGIHGTKKVTSIGYCAFDDCSRLTSITIPAGVTSIDHYAFYNCSSLASVTFGNDSQLTSIGYSAFENTAWYDKQPDGVVYVGKVLYEYKGTMPSNTSITVKEGTLGITSHAFYNCSSLTSITIPDSVMSIGSYAFKYCSSLTSVTFGENSQLTSIGADAFYNTAWYNNQPDGVVYAGKVLYEYKGTMPSNTSIVIKEGTVKIQGGAFYNCSGLTSITIPDSVTSIGEFAFYNCSSLTTINYTGTEEEWNRITISGGNTCLTEATIIFNYASSGSGDTGVDEEPEYTEGLTFEYDEETDSYVVTGYTGTASEVIICASYNDGTHGTKSVTSIGEDAFYKEENNPLTSITIPASVTSIGKRAFGWCTSLKSIIIPDSVTEIGADAFYGCSGLTSITISASVTSIDYGTFKDCNSLMSVTIPDRVTSIRTSAFSMCRSLTSVTFGENSQLTSIGDDVFSMCSSLTNVTFGENSQLTSIGSLAFFYCSSLTSLTIGSGVTSIGEDAFSMCSSLTTINYTGTEEEWNRITISGGNTCLTEATIIFNYASSGSGDTGVDEEPEYTEGLTFEYDEETDSYVVTGYTGTASEVIICASYNDGTHGTKSVTEIGEDAFYKEKNNPLTSITIPDSVTSIGNTAFGWCTSLKSIIIPDSVTSIGIQAFAACKSIESVTIPAGVTSIGGAAFILCTNLTSITVDKDNTVYYSKDNCIIETSSKTLIAGCSTSVIPDDGSITGIGFAAFGYVESLTNITIPDSVTSIGDNAFMGCGLTSVTIPDKVTSLGDYAFAECSSLVSITIPDSVTSIGVNAFYYAAWYDNQPDGIIYAGKVLYDYKGTMPSNTSIVIEEGTLGITGYAFNGCRGLTSITIPASVTSIGEKAFRNCSSLTSVTIGSGVTSIGEKAFSDCSSLTSVTIGSGVTSIGNSAFDWCYKLIEVYNKSSLEITAGSKDNGEVGYYAKNIYTEEGGSKLATDDDGYIIYTDGEDKILIAYTGNSTELTLPDGITEINQYAFYGSSLMSITIPDSVTSIGYQAFCTCSSLTTINYTGTEEEWNAITKGSCWDLYTGDYTIVYNYTEE